jgi:hypothetical protein
MASKVTAQNLVHVGKRKKKDFKKLGKGDGPLMDEVTSAVARAQVSEGGKEVVPVVIVYEQKPRRRKRGMAMFGPMF